MIRVRSWQEAEQGRIIRDTPHQKGTRVPLFSEAPDGGACAPQAFVVEQAPDWVLRAHYHGVHQFQVVAAGSGSIGRHPVAPLMVHYASPESGYGPITAGPRGLSYYTLRATPDEQTRYLPESRPLMREGLAKQHGMTAIIEIEDTEPLAPSENLSLQSLLSGNRDGAAVWRLRLAPGAALPASGVPGAGARYYFVAAGAMQVQGQALEKGSVCFAHDEPGFTIVATDVGLDLLVLQFPPEASRPPA